MTKVEYAVQWCEAIAADNSHGYDWTHGNSTRWGPDYDCSSLIITAYENAGIPVKSVGGAQRTYDMRTTFKACGFIEVQNWNRTNGVGLIRGDVLLNTLNHTEIFIGNGQLLKASSDYGRTQGDPSGNEIRIGGYYNYPWDCALRYSNQTEQYVGSPLTAPTAYEYALSGEVASVEPDYRQISCYVSTVSRNTKSVDYAALKDSGLIGTVIEAGYLYNAQHTEQASYVNPQLEAQVNAAKSAGIRYGLCTVVRARTVEQARNEIRWLRIYVQKYTPTMGLWLQLELTSNKAMCDMIIAEYLSAIKSLGLSGKCGLYATRAQLSKISWSKWQDYFLLWLVDHVSKTSEIEKILTPEFFMLEKS